MADALPGRPSPLGATPRDGGTNFAVASSVAEAAEVCLFDDAGTETRFRLPDYDGGAWHGFVPGAGPGQAYGFRVHGPYDAARGLRCNPAKLLLDPYARAARGEVCFGPEVFDYSWDDHDAPSSLDSAGHVPLSLVTDAAFDWGADAPLRRDFADTVLYEVHVKGFTMRHPGVPEELRGTYAGLAHQSVRSYLSDLGVTAVELLPVHQYVPDDFLLRRGLTNYWGYNTIGYFAPHAAYSAAARARVPWFSGNGVQGHGARAARRGARGHPRRGLQPHRGGRRGRPVAVLPRAGQHGVLPAAPGPPGPVLRHDGDRQLAERRQPGGAAADHGLAAVLADRDACRRVPVRPGQHPGAPGRRVQPRLRVLRPGGAGSGGVAGQAHRRTVGRRPDGQLRPGRVPGAVARVERQVPGHHARLLAQPQDRPGRVRHPVRRLLRPVRGRPAAADGLGEPDHHARRLYAQGPGVLRPQAQRRQRRVEPGRHRRQPVLELRF